MTELSSDARTPIQRTSLVVGPAAAIAVLLGPRVGFPLDPANPELNRMAAVALLMAVWWMTEAIPLAVTSLLPLALYPFLQISPYRAVASEYAHPLIFLFLGGFLIAMAIEESGLHRRAALAVVSVVGDRPRRIVFGFMLATAALSMWISNTATTLMMMPIAVSVILQAERAGVDERVRRRFQVALLLGTAYAASIGGVATYIGTPPNVLFRKFYEDAAPLHPISFPGWMLLAAPFCAVMLLATWGLLVYVVFPVGSARLLGGRNVIREQYHALGPITKPELRMAVIFLATALLWITRAPSRVGVGHRRSVSTSSWKPVTTVKISGDSTVAIVMAIICFIMPSGRPDGRPLVTWRMTTRLPWGILLLFGGGFALAAGLKSSGLDAFIGQWLAGELAGLSPVGRQGLVAGGMTFFTEITSNAASVNMLLPILGKTAGQLAIAPVDLMLPATLAASCAFMLPVATPPNAIVYGTGRIRMGEMIRAGFLLNLVSIAVITGWMAALAAWR